MALTGLCVPRSLLRQLYDIVGGLEKRLADQRAWGFRANNPSHEWCIISGRDQVASLIHPNRAERAASYNASLLRQLYNIVGGLEKRLADQQVGG